MAISKYLIFSCLSFGLLCSKLRSADASTSLNQIAEDSKDTQRSDTDGSQAGSVFLELGHKGTLLTRQYEMIETSQTRPNRHKLPVQSKSWHHQKHHTAHTVPSTVAHRQRSSHMMQLNAKSARHKEVSDSEFFGKVVDLVEMSALEGKMVDLQNKFAGGACQKTPAGDNCTHTTSEYCHWPQLKKFDLVISWVTNKPQSDITTHTSPTFLQVQASSGFENQAEIKYALRSYEQYGLLDYVGTIYILMDEKVLEKYGAPRFFDYKSNSLRIVTERDLGTKYIGHSKFEQFLNIDRIPGLSDYFLWLPDDNFMQKPFKMEYLYNADKGTPSLYSYGSFRLGWCDSQQAVGSTHGPVMMNKCAFTTVANQYWRLLEGGGANHTFDVLCLYTNAVRNNWAWKGSAPSFHQECHTNAISGCHATKKSKSLFINMQGNGISDEYNENIDPRNWGMNRFMPNGYAKWFHDEFPKPSRFERSP